MPTPRVKVPLRPKMYQYLAQLARVSGATIPELICECIEHDQNYIKFWAEERTKHIKAMTTSTTVMEPATKVSDAEPGDDDVFVSDEKQAAYDREMDRRIRNE